MISSSPAFWICSMVQGDAKLFDRWVLRLKSHRAVNVDMPSNQYWTLCWGCGLHVSRGLQLPLLLAVVIKRLLLIGWPSEPFPLEMGAYRAGINWRVPDGVSVTLVGNLLVLSRPVETLSCSRSSSFRWVFAGAQKTQGETSIFRRWTSLGGLLLHPNLLS